MENGMSRKQQFPVPGDIISIRLGDIVPADARLLEGDPLKIDQSALTGESLPVTKSPGDEVFSGSTCKQGEIEAVVIATGVHTFFGKAAHLVDSTNQVGHFQMVLTAIGNFCICFIAVGMLAEIIVMYPIQHRKYRDGIDNLLVLLIGGIPIAMPTVLSVTMAIGSHRLSQQGAITKHVLCSDKTGTLTLNKLSVDRNLIEVFAKDVDKEHVILLAARASRTENQDAIDAAIVGMLADPKEARARVREVHFLPFNPVDKRTALTYIDSDGNWHRANKGAPEQIIALCNLREDAKKKCHAIIDKFADPANRSLVDSSTPFGEASTAQQFGSMVPGTIDGKFDGCYIVKVDLGSEQVKGILYHVPINLSQSSNNVGIHGSRNPKKSKLAKHDPSRPKSNRSGYNFFFAQNYASLRPLFHGQERAISKRIGFLWNNLPGAERQEKGLRDKERYKTEMLEHKSSNNSAPQ
ncbi:hypothetical protein PIB30_013748 [Stylosanthes scabra]|uniref:P-type ATPase A domain-containing protein n=1 Tax=Stylosanthes scabra TaxID=79078 RepID=A0ABU6Y4M8_9FABA|nr:hypothetical protein [Stylosanthes scabra]